MTEILSNITNIINNDKIYTTNNINKESILKNISNINKNK